jgi:dTDP-4-amino-4,6-dideoxygalactose transaminase
MHHMPHVRLCCSGTIAVELALVGVGVEPGDEVIMGAYDFPGNFRCVEHLGALPVLVDIDPNHGCLDPARLEAAASASTKAILVSHLHSGMAAMHQICEFASARGIAVVEDACQAPGATVDGRLAGTWGQVATFSFGGSKLITAGRGGAVITSDPTCFQRIKVYSERGNDAYPLSELQAAVVLPQWESLELQNTKRQESVARLAARLTDCAPVRFCGQVGDASNRPSYYKVGLRLDASIDRTTWLAAMQSAGVAVDAGFRGFYRRSAKRCRRAGDFAAAINAAEHGVVLHHPVLLQPLEIIEELAAVMTRVTAAAAAR